MIIKDYYLILGIANGESDIDAIRYAYRSFCEQYHPDQYAGEDIKEKTAEINEAFLVLSDDAVKANYDSYLQGSANEEQFQSLLMAIDEKRNKAQAFTSNFFEELLQHKKKEKRVKRNKRWVWAIIAMIFLVPFCVGFIQACPRSAKNVEQLGEFHPPTSWTKCYVSNAFSFSVPADMEISFDENMENFSKLKQSTNNIKLESDSCFFLKYNDLANFEDETVNKESINFYGVMIVSYSKDTGFMKYDETEEINSYNKEIIEDELKKELGLGAILSNASYKWIDVNGAKALVIDADIMLGYAYQMTHCLFYVFQNKTELANILFTDGSRDEIIDIIKTFKWKRLND